MNNSVKFDAFDALLHASAIYAGQKELDEYESATGDEFDTKTQERIYRRLDKEYRYYSKDRKYSPVRETLKRIAIIILAFMSISFTCVLSIDAAREAIWNAIVEWSENFFCFKYEEPEEPNEPDEINLLEPPTEILEYKEPTVDEKFVKVEGKKTSQSYLVQYKYLNKLISYSQRPINPYDTFISNLEADLTEIYVNNNKGFRFEEILDNEIQNAVIWTDGIYAYTIFGNIEYEELLKIAESIE